MTVVDDTASAGIGTQAGRPVAGLGVSTRAFATVALLITALSLGASWSHILQIRGKASWDGAFWRAAMETLYRDYATIGAVIEIGAILLAWFLVFAVRRNRRSLVWAVVGAVLLTIAFFGLWIGLIAPINAVFATWTPDKLPSDWTAYRDRWEFWHAMIAAMKAGAFCTMTTAVFYWMKQRAF